MRLRKTTESNHPTTNPNPKPYFVAVQYGDLACGSLLCTLMCSFSYTCQLKLNIFQKLHHFHNAWNAFIRSIPPFRSVNRNDPCLYLFIHKFTRSDTQQYFAQLMTIAVLPCINNNMNRNGCHLLLAMLLHRLTKQHWSVLTTVPHII